MDEQQEQVSGEWLPGFVMICLFVIGAAGFLCGVVAISRSWQNLAGAGVCFLAAAVAFASLLRSMTTK